MGERLGGGKHKADILAEKDGIKIIVSLKWQQTSGTAEQEVPVNSSQMQFIGIMTLIGAYIVIGGNGWTKDRFSFTTWING